LGGFKVREYASKGSISNLIHYNIVNHSNATVVNVMGLTPLNIGFRRVLSANKWDRLVHLVSRVMMVQFTENEDVFRLNLTTSGFFTIKLTCIDMLNGHITDLKKYI
jgi:hypothetical protein